MGQVLGPVTAPGEGMKEELELSRSVQRVAFAPNPTQHDFAVAVVTLLHPCRDGKAVALARAGCRDGWSAFIELPDERSQLDVAYHDGKFYYMTTCSLVWVVGVADPAPTPIARVERARFPSGMTGNYHLAFSGDGALHVVCSLPIVCAQRYGPMSRPPPSLQAGSSSPSTPPPLCLRGQALLIGNFNQTLCVPVDDGAWLRPDSLYFTITNIYPRNSYLGELSDPDCRQDGVWLFDLATGDIGRPSYFKDKHDDRTIPDEKTQSTKKYSGLRLQWYKAIWFMPSMRKMQ